MINEIIQGVSAALYGEFGDGYEYYQNDVRQGLNEPCFFIAVLEPDISHLQKRRFLHTYPLDIHCFPAEPGSNAELCGVAERLPETLEFITLPNGDLLHGTGMRYQTEDGVLHFFVTYQCTMIRPENVDKMSRLEASVGTGD